MIKTGTRNAATAWILAGIPVISVVGSLMHFAYEWSGELAVIGLIAPVNESIWEHLKLIFWPSLLWWIIGYFRIKKTDEISAAQWFCSGSAGLFTGPLFITSFYYTYTGAFGIHSLFLDILSFLLGVTVAQLTALHLYRHKKYSNYDLLICLTAVGLFACSFILFTFSPPEIPLFQNPITGTYGI